jgi:hypothetical protein
MTERKMSILSFVKRCDPSHGKLSSEAFLFKYQEYINSYPFLMPIIEAYKSAEITPTQTRQAIGEALFAYMMEENAAKIGKAVEKAKKQTVIQKIKRGETTRIESPDIVLDGGYSIYVMIKNIDRDGNETIELGVDEHIQKMEEEETGKIIAVKVMKPMIFQSELFQQAQRKAALRVFATGNAVHARIINNTGTPLETILTRNDAIEMLFKGKKGPVMKQQKKTTKTLKWQGKAKQSRSVQPSN